MEEIALNYLSSSIPHHTSLLKDYSSRDPTMTQPTNTIQEVDAPSTNYNVTAGKGYYSLSRSGMSETPESSLSRGNSAEKFGRATRNIYEALKRGLRRLGSIKRNNSA